MTASRDEQVASWAVVVPVKRLDVAKSRLGVLGDDVRRDLALAFAADVVLAALACPVVGRVLVVTDDEDAAAAVRALGADVVADVPDAGLNPALEHGAEVAAAAGRAGVAALSADLPALRAEDLAAVLSAAPARVVVPDARGSGTTLLAAPRGQALDPRFGGRSLEAHALSGARVVPAPASLRRDVDTPADLAEAVAFGVGPRTAAVLSGLPDDVVAAWRSPRQGTMQP